MRGSMNSLHPASEAPRIDCAKCDRITKMGQPATARSVLECGGPLVPCRCRIVLRLPSLLTASCDERADSGRGLPHSKTLRGIRLSIRLVIVLCAMRGPGGIGCRCSFHGVPEDAVERVFGTSVGLLKRQAR